LLVANRSTCRDEDASADGSCPTHFGRGQPGVPEYALAEPRLSLCPDPIGIGTSSPVTWIHTRAFIGRSVHCCEEPPRARDALKFVLTSIHELDGGTDDEVFHGAGDHDFSGTSRCPHPPVRPSAVVNPTVRLVDTGTTRAGHTSPTESLVGRRQSEIGLTAMGRGTCIWWGHDRRRCCLERRF
jgi:hypothetical protein